MADSERPPAQPQGTTSLVFTTDPGAVIMNTPAPPYGATGVVNRAWIEATRIVGRQYTKREIENGWPLAMEPHRLASMQAPQDSTGQNHINTALIAACKKGQLPSVAFDRIDYELIPGGNRKPIGAWKDYAITAQSFWEWLATQNMEPSPHIAAWFAATGAGRTNETGQMAGRVLKKDMRPEWTGRRLAERRSELRGAKAPTQKLAAESGLDEREIRRRIEAWNGEKTNPLSPARMGNQREKNTQRKAKSASTKR